MFDKGGVLEQAKEYLRLRHEEEMAESRCEVAEEIHEKAYLDMKEVHLVY